MAVDVSSYIPLGKLNRAGFTAIRPGNKKKTKLDQIEEDWLKRDRARVLSGNPVISCTRCFRLDSHTRIAADVFEKYLTCTFRIGRSNPRFYSEYNSALKKREATSVSAKFECHKCGAVKTLIFDRGVYEEHKSAIDGLSTAMSKTKVVTFEDELKKKGFSEILSGIWRNHQRFYVRCDQCLRFNEEMFEALDSRDVQTFTCSYCDVKHELKLGALLGVKV